MGGEGLGRLLARLRREHGLSQSQLAELLAAVSGNPAITRHEVSRHERGVRAPVYWLPWYAEALEIPLAELQRAATTASTAGTGGQPDAGTTVDALRAACEWLVTEPPAVEHLRSGRRLGTGLIDQMQARAHELRRLDDHLGGADTVALVERELHAAQKVADEASYAAGTGRRLFAVLAELSQLAGWTASDAGQYARAERLYLDGVKAAHAAQDPAAAANLLTSLAYQITNTGNPTDAVLLAQTAVAGLARAGERYRSGRVRALLLERLAWAHAKAGHANAADRALAEVDDAFTNSDSDASSRSEPDPGWVYWLDRDEIAIMAGRCYVELKRPLRAVPLLTEAIDRYPADRSRETALYLTWLGQSYLQANEHDAAREALGRARTLAATVQSERLNTRIRELETAG